MAKRTRNEVGPIRLYGKKYHFAVYSNRFTAGMVDHYPYDPRVTQSEVTSAKVIVTIDAFVPVMEPQIITILERITAGIKADHLPEREYTLPFDEGYSVLIWQAC